jgi:hypothetical protein
MVLVGGQTQRNTIPTSFLFLRILRVLECIEIQLKAHIEKMERTELIIVLTHIILVLQFFCSSSLRMRFHPLNHLFPFHSE